MRPVVERGHYLLSRLRSSTCPPCIRRCGPRDARLVGIHGVAALLSLFALSIRLAPTFCQTGALSTFGFARRQGFATQEARKQLSNRKVMLVPFVTVPADARTSVAHWTANWDSVTSKFGTWGTSFRDTLHHGIRSLEMAARGGASAAWQAMLSSEGQLIYNLFRRHLGVFVPSFDPSTQIEADVFLQRSFWLRNLSVSPAAVSALTQLAPPGLNFTRFWVSDVRVSWKNSFLLDRSPIIVEIESMRATAGEIATGTHEEVEDIIVEWVSALGGVQSNPFEGRYPLLDGATFRVGRLELNISSPTRYGNLSVSIKDIEARAVDSEGQQGKLNELCTSGAHDKVISFSKLVDCSQASAYYVNSPSAEALVDLPDDFEPESHKFMIAPTPVSVLLTQDKNRSDMRQVLKQRTQISFPGRTAVLASPPFLSEAPAPQPFDCRLFPFPAPATEWKILFADTDPFDWIFSSWRTQPTKTKYAAVAGWGVGFCMGLLAITLIAAATLRPRLWVLRVLSFPFFR